VPCTADEQQQNRRLGEIVVEDKDESHKLRGEIRNTCFTQLGLTPRRSSVRLWFGQIGYSDSHPELIICQ